MSKNRSSFLKREREARKNEKRAMKRQRREERKLDVQQEGGSVELADGALAEESHVDELPVSAAPLAETKDAPSQP
jgi:hypothetical protein